MINVKRSIELCAEIGTQRAEAGDCKYSVLDCKYNYIH